MSSAEVYQLLLEIKADVAKAVQGLQQVEGAVDKGTKSMGGFQQAASMAAGVLLRDMVNGLNSAFSESLKLGGQVETLANSFEALSAASGGQMSSLEELRAATKGTVADIDLLRSANQAMLLGLPTEGFAELAGSAITLGHAMGIDAQYAVDSLTKGIGRQSKMILDNLGVVFDATEAYDWYAAKIGVNTNALDENAKKQAWMEYAIMQVTNKAKAMGDVTSETTIAQERWDATLKNLATSFGGLLAPLAQFAPIIEATLPAFSMLAVQVLPGIISGLGSAISQYGLVAVAQQALGSAVFSLSGLWTAAHGAMIAASNALKTSFLTNPVTLAIMAIITAVILLWQAWEHNWFGIRDILAGVVDWIMEKFGWLIDGLTAVWDAVNSLWNGISGFFGGIWDAINGAMEGSAEAMENGVGRMIGSVEGMIDTVPIVGDAMGGIRDLVLEMTGQTETYYKLWAEDQIRIIDETMAAEIAALDAGLATQLETLRTAYEEQTAARTEAFQNEYDAWVQHYLDQLPGKTLEGFEKVLAEYTKHFDSLLAEVQAGMQEQLDEVVRQRDAELKETTDKYAQMISETETFFDEMLGIYSANLEGIRDARKEDLRDLELTYLLQKEALEKSLSDHRISEEEFQEQMKALDQKYRDDREQISDDYRIQEIQAEIELEEKTKEIETRKAEEVQGITEKREAEINRINEEAAHKEDNIRKATKAQAEALELLKQIALEGIKRKEAEITEKYESDMSQIEQNYKQGQKEAYDKYEREKNEIVQNAENRRKQVMEESQNKIKASQDSFLGQMGKGWSETCNKIGSAWSGLCSSLGSTFQGAANWIGQQASNLWDSISQGAAGLWDALTGGSIWTDMLKEMKSQAKDYLGQTSEEFNKFNPEVEAGIQKLQDLTIQSKPTSSPNLTETKPTEKSSISISIPITVTGNTFSEELDVEEAFRKGGDILAQKLLSMGIGRVPP